MRKIEEYKSYIANLKANGVPVIMYEVECCGALLETRANTTSRDWDSFCECPYCSEPYIKLTLGDKKGVLAHPISVPLSEVTEILNTIKGAA